MARTIRRLPTTEREDSNPVVAMRSTPVAGQPTDAAGDDAPTVTGRAVEQRQVIVFPAISGAPASGQRRRRQCTFQSKFQTCPSRQSRGHNHHRLQWKAAIIQVERVNSSGPGSDVLMEVAQAVEPTTKSHAPVEEHDESLLPKRQRGRPATHCWPSPGSPEYTVGCPGCDGRS